MTLRPVKEKLIVNNYIFQVMILAIFILIISSSMILFVTDRGNLISYSLEQIQGWKNPSYQELVEFLETDETAFQPFIEGTYECKHFSIDLIRNARAQGYRAGYVSLSNPQGNDHAIVCFETTDNGLVFVEPQLNLLITSEELKDMLENKVYSIRVQGLPMESAMPLDNVRVSWYMVI
jgi:hypothetical protein